MEWSLAGCFDYEGEYDVARVKVFVGVSVLCRWTTRKSIQMQARWKNAKFQHA